MRNAASVFAPVAFLVVAAVALIASLHAASGRAPAALLQPIDASQFALVELPSRPADFRPEQITYLAVHAIPVHARRI